MLPAFVSLSRVLAARCSSHQSQAREGDFRVLELVCNLGSGVTQGRVALPTASAARPVLFLEGLMETRVVNLKKEACDVYIGRPGRGEDGYFGNPIRRFVKCPVCGEVHRDAGATLDCYKQYFWDRINRDPEFRRRVEALEGKRLGCFCKPNPCHGDVIAAWFEAGKPLKKG